MNVERWSLVRDGELSEAALGKNFICLSYSVTRYVYPPGTCFPDQSHRMDKMDAVMSGQFRMTVEGREVILEAGDCWLCHVALSIPPQSPAISQSSVSMGSNRRESTNRWVSSR